MPKGLALAIFLFARRARTHLKQVFECVNAGAVVVIPENLHRVVADELDSLRCNVLRDFFRGDHLHVRDLVHAMRARTGEPQLERVVIADVGRVPDDPDSTRGRLRDFLWFDHAAMIDSESYTATRWGGAHAAGKTICCKRRD